MRGVFMTSTSKPGPKQLYDFPFSGNGYKIRLALAQLGLACDHEIVDLIARETRAPDFLEKNPMGQIPVLELEDGTMLRESNAILWWLTEDTKLMPEGPLARTRVLQWMMFEQSNIDKVLGRTRFLRSWPEFRETTQRDWDGWYEVGSNALAVMEAELAAHPFIVGDTYSAADICLYGYTHCAEEGGFDLSKFPAVSAWLARVRAQQRHIAI
jgi:glutathione S-transferase